MGDAKIVKLRTTTEEIEPLYLNNPVYSLIYMKTFKYVERRLIKPSRERIT